MSKDIYLYVYTITGVDPLTGEIRNYHGITNDIWRRMGEHVRSGLITALCND
jgi:predicted GIY-YIG superfamily endonuclease